MTTSTPTTGFDADGFRIGAFTSDGHVADAFAPIPGDDPNPAPGGYNADGSKAGR